MIEHFTAHTVDDVDFSKILNILFFPKIAVIKPSKIYVDVLHILVDAQEIHKSK